MAKERILLILVFVLPLCLYAGSHTQDRYPPGSVAVTDNAFSLFFNPAASGYRSEFQLIAYFPEALRSYKNEYSLLVMGGKACFSGEWLCSGEQFYQRWQYSLGLPAGKWLNLGLRYRWFGTVEDKGEIDLGFISRPWKFLSLGGVIQNVTEANGLPVVYQLGIGARPLGKIITLAIDVTGQKGNNDLEYKTYIELKPVDGISLSSEYYPENGELRLGFNINLINSGIGFVENGRSAYFHLSNSKYRTIFERKARKLVVFKLPQTIHEEPILYGFRKPHTLKALIDKVKEIAKDKSVHTVLFVGNNLSYGFSRLYEVRNAIEELRTSGKHTCFYSESMNNGTYYLATACDKIFLNPAGTLWLVGFSSTYIFIKDLLDKLGIEAEYEHIGNYKTAADMFTRDSMSVYYREMIETLLEDFYNSFISEVSKTRGFSVEKMLELIDNGPYMAELAKEKGLIDDCLYEDQVLEKLKKTDKAKLEIVKIKRYSKRKEFREDWSYPAQKDKIALVYAVGSISEGKSKKGFYSNVMGSETIARAIRKAREDKSVKAIVFRIDSPGGSALASDVIWREVYLTTTGRNRKPFIVSMSGLAASGGYYIACQADTIIATPYTITGSIGVLGGKFNVRKLCEKIGINTATIKKGKYSDYMSIYRELTPDERLKLQKIISYYYDVFTKHVADGRGISQDSVKSIGEGRVWSGTRGKTIGLVDIIGSLDTAIEIARQKAGLSNKDIAISIYPKPFNYIFEVSVSDFFTRKTYFGKLLEKDIKFYSYLFDLWLNNNENVFMIMPYIIKVE